MSENNKVYRLNKIWKTLIEEDKKDPKMLQNIDLHQQYLQYKYQKAKQQEELKIMAKRDVSGIRPNRTTLKKEDIDELNSFDDRFFFPFIKEDDLICSEEDNKIM